MSYQAANHFRQGDQALVLGGKVEPQPGGQIPFLQYRRVPLVAATGTGAGAVLAWANPTGKTILVAQPIIDLVTASTGAASIDVGVAANGTTAGDNLFDGLDVNAAAGLFMAPSGAGANDAALRKMTASEFITGTASASLAGLVGSIFIPFYVYDS